MAILKADGYGSIRIETGDDDIDGAMKEQLSVSLTELREAINAENLTDRLFARILKNRSSAHQQLLAKIPAAAE